MDLGAALERYVEQGWCVLPFRLEEELTSAVVEWFLRRGADRPDRVLDAWRTAPPVRRLAAHPGVRSAVDGALGGPSFAFQTLNFSRGTEQSAHADSIHFDTVPSGLMCGAWVALEDVGPEQGPLFVVPGSHRCPSVEPREAFDPRRGFSYLRYESLVAERTGRARRLEVPLERGQVVLWHPDLLHGGAAVGDRTRTRWSQVTHYFGRGAVYVTPMHSAPDASEFRVRDPLVDICSGHRVVHEVDGRPARFVHRWGGRTRVLAPDDPPVPLPTRVTSTVIGRSRLVRGRLALAVSTHRGRLGSRSTR